MIDDDKIYQFTAKMILEATGLTHSIKTFFNGQEAIDYLISPEHQVPENLPDVIFLDINMPMMTGIELISLIDNKTKVVITTAFREFAVESYDLDVLDYLVKPIPLPRFIKCIHKIITEFNTKNSIKLDVATMDSHVFIKVDKKMVKINIDEILFIEGMKEYIKIITFDKTYITHKSITSLSEELPNDRFIRVHKSYTIAIDKVKFLEGNRIQIQTYTIPIGRNFSKAVKNRIFVTTRRINE